MRLTTYLQAHTKDTPVQNIKMARHGLPITIEHPKGTQRKLFNDDGKLVYSVHMHNHYGYFDNTKGVDGDDVDCIVGPMENAKEVYVIWMVDKGPDVAQREDEDKVMVGFPNAEAARRAFHLHYPKNFFGGMTVFSVANFKNKLATAQLPYRRKKLAAKAVLSRLSVGRRKEGAEGSQSHRPHAAVRSTLHLADDGGASRVADGKKPCPKCGSKEWTMLPTDYEYKRCQECGRVFA